MISSKRAKATLPYVGYGLVVFSILDLLIYLIPLRFFDFNWEFNTFNYFVDSSPGFIVGVWIVLSRELDSSKEKYFIEKTLIRYLAWFTIPLSIIYFLLIPIGISASFRLYKNTKAQAVFQQNNRITQIEKVRTKVDTASDNDLLGLQKQTPNINSPSINQTPSIFRQSLLSQIDDQIKTIKTQTEQSISNSKELLIKRTLKSTIGALITGVLFLSFWLQNVKRKIAIGFPIK
jgi:hypothetical protein